MKDLTEAQKRVLDELRANPFAKQKQIGAAIGITGVAVLQHLRAMEKKGFIRRVPRWQVV
jgi:DNA-binding MarR family transcriptional regulator